MENWKDIDCYEGLVINHDGQELSMTLENWEKLVDLVSSADVS